MSREGVPVRGRAGRAGSSVAQVSRHRVLHHPSGADAASPALVSCPSALVASLFGLEAALTLKSGEKLERKNRVILLSL